MFTASIAMNVTSITTTTTGAEFAAGASWADPGRAAVESRSEVSAEQMLVRPSTFVSICSLRVAYVFPQPHMCGIEVRAFVPDHCHLVRRNLQRWHNDLDVIGVILHESGGKHSDQICARYNLGNKKEVWHGKHDSPLASLAFEYCVGNTSESAAFW